MKKDNVSGLSTANEKGHSLGVNLKRCPRCFMPWDWYACTPDDCREPKEFAEKVTDSVFYQHEVLRRAKRIRAQVGKRQSEDNRSEVYQQHYEELREATFCSNEKAGRWLLDFVRTDLSKLRNEQWKKLRYRIDRFALVGVPDAHAKFPMGPRTYSWNWHLRQRIPGRAMLALERTPEEEIEQDRLPLRETVEVLQSIVTRDLDAFLETDKLIYLQPSGKLMLRYDKKRQRVIEHFQPDMTEDDTPENVFRFRCARLIYAMGSRLRRCLACKDRFLAGRRDQQYCSVRCQARATMRRWRQTPPERFGKRGRPRKEEQLTKNKRMDKA